MTTFPPGYTQVADNRIELRDGGRLEAVIQVSRVGRKSMRMLWCVKVLVDGQWSDGNCHENLEKAIAATGAVVAGDTEAMLKLSPGGAPAEMKSR